MRHVKKIEFDIKCKQKADEEARKKRKRDEEIAEQKILHAHVVDIRSKNAEIHDIKEKMETNYLILENIAIRNELQTFAEKVPTLGCEGSG